MGLKSKDIIDNLIRKTDFLKAGETILPGGRISRGFYGTEVEKKINSNQKIPGSPHCLGNLLFKRHKSVANSRIGS